MKKLRILAVVLVALLACLSVAQTPALTVMTRAESYLRQIVNSNGNVKVMFAGDSLISGNNNDMGLRVPIGLGLKLHGIEPTFVGERTETAAQGRWFYNTFGNVGKFQAHGTIQSVELLNGFANGSTLLGGGTASYALSAFSTALASQTPDIVVLCVGTNDPTPGSVSVYTALLNACKSYNADMPVVWLSPFDSISTTVSYYNVDTSRAAIKENIRLACAAATNPVYFVDSTQVMGMFTWYPGTDLSTTNNNANGMFADSTHLQNPGWALVGVGALSALFGDTPSQELALLCTAQPYQPIDFPDNGQDITSGNSAVMIAGGAYKRVMTDLTVYNSDASATATVTVYKRRVSQDGSTTATDTAWRTFKVPAGATVGWTWAFDADPSKRTGPTAFYNEGWKVAVTGATCNVRLGGKSVVY